MPTTQLSLNNSSNLCPALFFIAAFIIVIADMRMMVFLSIESCLGFIERLEEPHYHCGPEKSCPEACPYTGCLMRGQRKGEKGI